MRLNQGNGFVVRNEKAYAALFVSFMESAKKPRDSKCLVGIRSSKD